LVRMRGFEPPRPYWHLHPRQDGYQVTVLHPDSQNGRGGEIRTPSDLISRFQSRSAPNYRFTPRCVTNGSRGRCDWNCVACTAAPA